MISRQPFISENHRLIQRIKAATMHVHFRAFFKIRDFHDMRHLSLLKPRHFYDDSNDE